MKYELDLLGCDAKGFEHVSHKTSAPNVSGTLRK